MTRRKIKKLKKLLKGMFFSFFFCMGIFLPLKVIKESESTAVMNDEKREHIEKEYSGEDRFFPEPLKDIEKVPHVDILPPEENEEMPFVPPDKRRKVTEADLSYKESPVFLKTHGISLKNGTRFSDKEIASILDSPVNIKFKETEKPQFLIYHTHATEAFTPFDSPFYDCRYNFRSRDNNSNMVSVGNEAVRELEKAGLSVLHDTSQHDYPSYNGSYKNSFASFSNYLKENSEIKVGLDLHRDAIQKDTGEIIKPVLIKDDKKYAQIMIIANCDDGSGLIPNWRENFRFAKELYIALENEMPGICRPILLSYRKYNQQLSTGALLIEVGGHANTLEEAKRSGKILGKALADIYENFKE